MDPFRAILILVILGVYNWSHLVTLLSTMYYLHLICYQFYNHPCNFYISLHLASWLMRFRDAIGASEIARHRCRMKWRTYSKRFGFSDVRVVSCKVYVCCDHNCTVMISAQNAYTSPVRSCSEFVSNLHISTLCDWSRKECMAGNFRTSYKTCISFCKVCSGRYPLPWMVRVEVGMVGEGSGVASVAQAGPSWSVLKKRAPFCCLG